MSLFLVSLFLTAVLVSAQDIPPGLPAIQQAYTPNLNACPDNFRLIRTAGSISNQLLGSDESSYISTRESAVLPDAWNTYLQNVLSSTRTNNSSLPSYVSSILSTSSASSLPRLGIAISGGGYRAAIFGAGVLNALDNRNDSSRSAGTAGLLQASSYITGNSGSSWLLSSALQANFPTIQTIVFGPQQSSDQIDPTGYGGWNAAIDIQTPASSEQENLQFFESILAEISGKLSAGFPVTITDVWARLLARHFTNGTHTDSFFDDSQSTHGAGNLLSDLPNQSSFRNHQVPFPIIVADSISPNEDKSNIIPGDTVPLTNTIFEFTPFEMGSYDPTLSAFIPTEFLGTTNSSVCVTGFDQLAYVFGTSSQLFNELNTSAVDLASSPVGPLFSLLSQGLPQPSSIQLDLSLYPNPFFNINSSSPQQQTFIDSDQEFLGLVDGGEDGQVIPLQPLLVKSRNVDVIFAIDASADTEDNFAAGLSLIATQNRTSISPFSSAYSFPQVPNTITDFISQGLATGPTFFGCTSSSSPSSSTDSPPPLLIYLANGAPPPGQAPLTNTSTQQTSYEPSQIQSMLDQTFVIATQGRGSASSLSSANSSSEQQQQQQLSTDSDPNWPACLACAVVDRVRERQGVPRTGLCETCFTRYCWVP